jgi:hypothetical protein
VNILEIDVVLQGVIWGDIKLDDILHYSPQQQSNLQDDD